MMRPGRRHDKAFVRTESGRDRSIPVDTKTKAARALRSTHTATRGPHGKRRP
jgi:hypothetical protein